MVIFGCGYVGRLLAAEAVARGIEVWALSRNARMLASLDCLPHARRICADLHTADWHAQVPGDWDYAVNLVSSAGGGLDGYRLSYLEGNRSIVKWAGHRLVQRYLYTSATSVYPQTSGEWVGEGDVPARNELSPNGRILREAEEELLASPVAETVLVSRLGGIYGPGRHLYLNRILEGASSIPGDGRGWLNLIHLQDIVSAIWCLLEAAPPGTRSIYNVVDNEPARKQEIVDWLANRLGRPSLRFDPQEQTARSPGRRTREGLPSRRVANRKIREELHWHPMFPSFREGYGQILADGIVK